MKDPGTVGDDGCSEALEVSAKDQILGQSLSCDGSTAPAFIWENGSMIDLNTLIPPNSSLHLQKAA
jgi:probable HAF family extracellular repeat protein